MFSLQNRFGSRFYPSFYEIFRLDCILPDYTNACFTESNKPLYEKGSPCTLYTIPRGKTGKTEAPINDELNIVKG